MAGEDPKALYREHKVEAAKDDLQQTEVHKGKLHSSTNRGSKVGAKNQDMHGPTTSKMEAQSLMNLINAGKAKMMRTASKK